MADKKLAAKKVAEKYVELDDASRRAAANGSLE
jgi:hypothetical protein